MVSSSEADKCGDSDRRSPVEDEEADREPCGLRAVGIGAAMVSRAEVGAVSSVSGRYNSLNGECGKYGVL